MDLPSANRRVGSHFIIQFHDLFLRTKYHSGLNLLSGYDSHLLFIIFQTFSIVEITMPIKDAKKRYLCTTMFVVFIINPQNTVLIF